MNKVASLAFIAFCIYFTVYAIKYEDVLYLLRAIMSSLVAYYFFKQSKDHQLDATPLSVIICMIHFFIPLAFTKSENVFVQGDYTIVGVLSGIMLSSVAVVDLGSSIGLLPALRKIKIKGIYRYIRHPMYTGYLITLTSFTLENFSRNNLTLLVIFIVLMLARIKKEEKVLITSDEYKEYVRIVRFKVIPGVY